MVIASTLSMIPTAMNRVYLHSLNFWWTSHSHSITTFLIYGVMVLLEVFFLAVVCYRVAGYSAGVALRLAIFCPNCLLERRSIE